MEKLFVKDQRYSWSNWMDEAEMENIMHIFMSEMALGGSGQFNNWIVLDGFIFLNKVEVGLLI